MNTLLTNEEATSLIDYCEDNLLSKDEFKLLYPNVEPYFGGGPGWKVYGVGPDNIPYAFVYANYTDDVRVNYIYQLQDTGWVRVWRHWLAP